MSSSETLDETSSPLSDAAAIPGVAVVFTGSRPVFLPTPLFGASVTLGRDVPDGVTVDDSRASRRHAELVHLAGRWTVRDLGSRNGTWLDGQRVEGTAVTAAPFVLRVGNTVVVAVDDVRQWLSGRVEQGERVVGPVQRASLRRIEQAARLGRDVLVVGESGVGKEGAARAFHAVARAASAPFVAVNCAAIPEGVAERLLFGALRGAYTGSTSDTTGYLESASGGTLFLDEMGELDLAVQAKLLRVLETREVLPLGATRPRRVDVRLVCATHRDLRRAVADGRFRQDLYFRIAQPEVRLAPLRERREEIPWLVAGELARCDASLTADARFVERCAVLRWPGNVRELLVAVREAADTAAEAGASAVTPEMLPPDAGVEFARTSHEPEAAGDAQTPSAAAVEAALAKERGNVSAAARALGLHRTQLYRLMQRHGVKPTR